MSLDFDPRFCPKNENYYVHSIGSSYEVITFFKNKINLQCQESFLFGFVLIFVKKNENCWQCSHLFFLQNKFSMSKIISIYLKMVSKIMLNFCHPTNISMDKKSLNYADFSQKVLTHQRPNVAFLDMSYLLKFICSDAEIFGNHMPDKISSIFCHLNLMMSRCKSSDGRCWVHH